MYVETLKRLKKQSKMTTAEIAEKSGIPEPTLEKLFAGKTKRPTLQTVTKLAHLFGCTLDDLQNANFEGQKEIPSAPAATGTERISIEETDKLLAALGFIEEGGELSDDDLLFLQGVVTLMNAWFEKRKRK
ncbi:helix-turn-helix domain-containing protein [Agathobaculum sp.]|uniref:helix-turn-helix domain-containing protein n=1 Tax=Agathobaculum sp. TaxID=2048138 RepID=UPI003AF00004